MSDQLPPDDSHGWGLVMPFLTDSKDFAYGVEFGMLWMEMKTETTVEGYYCLANQDVILLAASRLKWTVDEVRPHDECWFFLRMHR